MDRFNDTSNMRQTRGCKRGRKNQGETRTSKKSRTSAAPGAPDNSSFGELSGQASLPDFLANYNIPESGRGRRGRPSGLPSVMPSVMSSGMPNTTQQSNSSAYNVMGAQAPTIPDYFANYTMADSARGRQARTSAVTSGTYASSLYNAMVAQAPTLDYNANYAMGNVIRGRPGRTSGMPSATMTSSQYGAIYAQAPMIDYTPNFAVPDPGRGRQARDSTVTTGSQIAQTHTPMTAQASIPNYAEFAMTDPARGKRSRPSTVATSTITSGQYNMMTAQAQMSDYTANFATTPKDNEASTSGNCRYMTRSQHQRANPHAPAEANNTQSAANQVLYPNMMSRTTATVPALMPPPTTANADMPPPPPPPPRYNTRSAAHKLPVSAAPARGRSRAAPPPPPPSRAPRAAPALQPPQQDQDAEESEEPCTLMILNDAGEIQLIQTVRRKNIDPRRVHIIIENGEYTVSIDEERQPSTHSKNNLVDVIYEQSDCNKKILVAMVESKRAESGVRALEYNPATSTAQPREDAGGEETPNTNSDQTPNNTIPSHSIPSHVTSRPMPNGQFFPNQRFINPNFMQFLAASAQRYLQRFQHINTMYQNCTFPNVFIDPRFQDPSQHGMGQFGQYGGWH